MKQIVAIVVLSVCVLGLSFLLIQSASTRASYKTALAERDIIIRGLQEEAATRLDSADNTAQLDACRREKNALVLAASEGGATPSKPAPVTAKADRSTLMTACTMAKMLITNYIVETNGFAEKHIKFPIQDCTETTTDMGGGTYGYLWSVRYKNSFNADMESKVAATVLDNGDGSWSLTAVEFQ